MYKDILDLIKYYYQVRIYKKMIPSQFVVVTNMQETMAAIRSIELDSITGYADEGDGSTTIRVICFSFISLPNIHMLESFVTMDIFLVISKVDCCDFQCVIELHLILIDVRN